MPRIDFLIFGYRKITVADDDLKAALRILFSLGISVRVENSSFFLKERDVSIVNSHFSGKIEYSVSELRGLFGFLKSHSKSYGAIIGSLLGFALLFTSSGLVWDVRIEGTSSENHAKIIEELEEAGFSVGTAWKSIDKSEIEARVLTKSETVSWININRRGTVAYVSVIDKTDFDEPPPKSGYANIVAVRDGIVEEISVKNGYPMVSVGETVRKGQILISGVPPVGSAGGLCYAEGSVIARYSGEISVETLRNAEVLHPESKELLSLSVNFFGKNINIFKRYGNSTAECDIIKDIRWKRLFGGKKLPIKTEREYLMTYTASSVTRSDAEMINSAKEEHSELLAKALSGATLYRIKTSGKFTDSSYILHTEFLCAADIGRHLEFDAEIK